MYYTLLLICSLVFGSQYYLNGSPQEVLAKPLIINLNQCTKEVYNVYWEFGSSRFRVMGRSRKACRIEVRTETEGSFTTSNCMIPAKLSKLGISKKSKQSTNAATPGLKYSSDISRFCTLVKSGNLLADPQVD
jgi:hypothetical protein